MAAASHADSAPRLASRSFAASRAYCDQVLNVPSILVIEAETALRMGATRGPFEAARGKVCGDRVAGFGIAPGRDVSFGVFR